MIEKLVNSKTRLKILKLFLSHIDDRYYLRELERLLDESLSPLRRQLLKLTSIGILMVEEEANLKYYRLNKDFEGLEELRELVLEKKRLALSGGLGASSDISSLVASSPIAPRNDMVEIIPKPALQLNCNAGLKIRYDLAVLSFVSIFVLITAIFVVHANNKNIKQVAKLISGEPLLPRVGEGFKPSPTATSKVLPVGNGEMVSRKWKVIPGNIPALSSGETGEEKNSKEL